MIIYDIGQQLIISHRLPIIDDSQFLSIFSNHVFRMLINIKYLLISFFLLFFSCAGDKPEYRASSGSKYLGVPAADIEQETKSLLNSWYKVLPDTINGGYWTNLAHDWHLQDNQDKMLVTQSRGLWTASKAAQIFPQHSRFKRVADHGYVFLTGKMWDVENSGFYQYYYLESQSGDPQQPKSAYGNAFALYALSEYAKINDDPQVTGWIRKTFQWLEQNAHDREFKGYYNAVFMENSAERQNFYMNNPSLKDQNSSIHLMEAFSNSYRVWPDSLLRQRLQEIFKLVRDIMINKKGSLNLFFTRNWQTVSFASESRSKIMSNIYTDHVSFGHDIETAYLLLDAANVLYGKADSVTIMIAKKLVDHTLDNGFDKDFYGLFDKGYYFSDKNDIEIVNAQKVWWAQAEALHSLAIMSRYFTRDERYRQAFAKMWVYINEQMIDHCYGGWYNNGLDSDPGTAADPKGHQWKSCYHDGRALMQLYQYSRRQEE